MKYKRILIKLSGEALSGNGESGILSSKALLSTLSVIKDIHDLGVEVTIVTGAGNICRGAIIEKSGIDRVTGDKMGMLGTAINAFAVSSSLKSLGVDSEVLSAIELGDFAPKFDKDLADKLLKEGKIIVFAAGTGKPFFTTDTCATLRAIETGCDAIFMAKNGVEGVYDSDPRINKDAKMFKEITCSEMIKRNLKVMDLTAVEMLKDKDIDVRVFSMSNPENFVKILNGEDIGTTIKKG